MTRNLPRSACLICRHLLDLEAGTCAAFPSGVPESLWYGTVNHRTPYPGDGGMMFEKGPSKAMELLDEKYGGDEDETDEDTVA